MLAYEELPPNIADIVSSCFFVNPPTARPKEVKHIRPDWNERDMASIQNWNLDLSIEIELRVNILFGKTIFLDQPIRRILVRGFYVRDNSMFN